MRKAVSHVRGLDSIRFICALWVYFGHGAQPPIKDPFISWPLASNVFRALFNNLWSGASAVIVFFVISGFCIHYPFAGTNKSPQLKSFYSRRFVRILIPIAFAAPLSGLVEINLTLLQDSVLWSLLAELIYYICYPGFRYAQLKFGSWRGLIGASFLLAFVVVATNPRAGNYPSYGPELNWVLGLPCWLMGCMAAEIIRTKTVPLVSIKRIWLLRGTVFGAAVLCSILRYHSPLGYPWTLNFFAILVAFWLVRELAFREHFAPPRIMEWAGLWSYSLYLLHLFADKVVVGLCPTISRSLPFWPLRVLFVLSICYLFYFVIERPSHALARALSQKLKS